MSAAWMLGALGVLGLAWLGRSSSSPAPVTPLPAVPPLEDYASLQLQTRCDPLPKPGVVAFRDWVLVHFDGLTDLGIGRDCAQGGTSEHKEGRALDLGVTDHAAAARMLRWLLEPDEYGRPHARLRAAGIMYVIYNRHIWRAHRERDWQPYTGASPHTDHMHLSFSWAGARAHTTFYQQFQA